MTKPFSVANVVMIIGGAVTFLFSFLGFLGTDNQSLNAWGRSLFPLATIPAILGAAMVVVCVLDQVGTKLPEPVLTFSWRQILFTWGVVAFTIMVAYVVLDTGVLTFKVGGVFMILGSAAMAVGSLVSLLGIGTADVTASGGDRLTPPPPSPGTTPPSPPAGPGGPPPPPPPPAR
jgi:hypothetical protein